MDDKENRIKKDMQDTQDKKYPAHLAYPFLSCFLGIPPNLAIASTLLLASFNWEKLDEKKWTAL